MTDPLLCTEIIFGTGDLFRTGSAAGPGTLEQQWEKGNAQKNPLGPGQTDLVRIVQGAQGSMGIVTWGSVKLEVLPQVRRVCFASEKNLEKLIEFSYCLLERKLADEFLILNDFALASMLAGGPQDIRAVAARQAPFTLIYALCGYEYRPEERVAYQQADIADIAASYRIEVREEIPGAKGEEVTALLDGSCPEPYWKLRYKGGWREIFFLTTLNRVPSFVDRMRNIAARHGYPEERIGVYIQPIQQGRSCHLEFNLFHDPGNTEEAERARALFDEASSAMAEAGGFFSRPYGSWNEMAYERCPDTVDALRMVKGMLDPDGVLNRGKLCYEEV
jgi:FAD/FMN-containing dehydrogenase